MSSRWRLIGDVAALLANAPRAVDSFSQGHWMLMQELERRAPAIVARPDVIEAASFLSDVVFLKRPHTTDRAAVRQAILAHPGETLGALDALSRVNELDYAVMDTVAQVPWFGRGGGRSFNSAVMRLVCPASFGIVDWRNIAVLCGSPDFDGLVAAPITFHQFSCQDVVAARGQLPFTMDVYRLYNDALRSIAAENDMRAADVDLILWTHSIQRQAFPQFTVPIVSSSITLASVERAALRNDHYGVARRLVDGYLLRLREAGTLSRNHLLVELSSFSG